MHATRRSAALAGCAIWIALAVAAFATTACILQVLRNDLDPVAMPLSAYLRGPYGGWLRGAYYVMASGLVALAWASHRATRREFRSALASVLFTVSALALPMVAMTVLYEHTPQENLARFIHGEAAQTTFLCLVVGMLIVSTRWLRDEYVRAERHAGIVLAWLAFVQMWVLALWKGLPPGLTQKALIALILLWLGWASRQLWLRGASRD